MGLLAVAAFASTLLTLALGAGSGAALVEAAAWAGLGTGADAATSEALPHDDECLSGHGSEEYQAGACAVNALQRGSALVQATPDDSKEAASAPVSAPISTWDEIKATPHSSDEAATAPVRKEVSTWAELKAALQASPQGGRFSIPERTKLVFGGTLDIAKGAHVEIVSKGAILDGRNSWGNVRMFYVRGSLSLSGLLIENGKTDYAGALYFDFGSSGNITDCRFRKNEATYMGGAIVSKGSRLALYNVDFDQNHAQNTCHSKLHCSRRRRHSRVANAVYVLGHTKVDASFKQQPKDQDFYFDSDFNGMAMFHCKPPRMEAARSSAKRHVHVSDECNLTML